MLYIVYSVHYISFNKKLCHLQEGKADFCPFEEGKRFSQNASQESCPRKEQTYYWY